MSPADPPAIRRLGERAGQTGSATAYAARYIRTERDRRGWSAEELARRCARAGCAGLTRGTIAKIESGVRTNLTADEAVALAVAFDVSLSTLLGQRARTTEPIVTGDLVALTFRVGNCVVDPEGRLTAWLERVDSDGASVRTGDRADTLAGYLSPEDTWLLARPDTLHRLAADPDKDA